MPLKLMCCVSLPPATILSVPIYEFSVANEELVTVDMEQYYQCCGKSVCSGCIYSFAKSGNDDKCPFCNSDRGNRTEEENNEDLMKRVEANDPASICLLAGNYHDGRRGFLQDNNKAMELWMRAADLGCSQAHFRLGDVYYKGGDMKKAKFHNEAAALAGHEVARSALGIIEAEAGNIERAIKHWTIGASYGDYQAMAALITLYENGLASRESIDSTLADTITLVPNLEAKQETLLSKS
jgi:TPR repeat protein